MLHRAPAVRGAPAGRWRPAHQGVRSGLYAGPRGQGVRQDGPVDPGHVLCYHPGQAGPRPGPRGRLVPLVCRRRQPDPGRARGCQTGVMRGRLLGRPPLLFFTSCQGGLCARSPTGARSSCRGVHPGPSPGYWGTVLASRPSGDFVVLILGAVTPGRAPSCMYGSSGGRPEAGN